MGRYTKVSSEDGRYLLCPKDAVLGPRPQRNTERFIRRAWNESTPGQRRMLLDLAESLRSGASRHVDLALPVLAHAMSTGSLAVVRMPVTTDGLDAPTVTDIGELIDPIDGPPARGLLDGPGGEEPTPPVEPGPTWLSFEVVDDRGATIEGDFQIAIDATIDDRGALDDTTRRYDELRPTAEALLGLRSMRWKPRDPTQNDPEHPTGPTEPTEPAGPTGPTGGPTGPTDRPAVGPTTVSFELVDENGTPLAARFVLRRHGTQLAEGEVTTTGYRAEAGSGELEVELSGIAIDEA